MKKRILPILFACVVCLGVFHPFGVHAITPLDPDGEASLRLHYQKDGVSFPDLQISIYRVAEALPDGTFERIEPFASYRVNIHDITKQEQWKQTATTLGAYIVADQIVPDREGQTNPEGVVTFSDLETGLYFVSEVIADHFEGTYVFDPFMVYVPTPLSDGNYDYDVEARPKCTEFIPKTKYTVTKLWKDAGNQNNRPDNVTVEIYKDGVLQETQVLDAENNWSYTWDVSGNDLGKWTVTERFVPDNYKVTIAQNGSHFTVINTCKAQPEIPQTGDTFTPLPWILAMCFSGMMLLILGIYGRRQK